MARHNGLRIDYMFTTYAIQSKTKNYIYVGLTSNLERRIEEHNRGKNRSTKAYVPFELIYSKIFSTRPEAREHEKILKSGY